VTFGCAHEPVESHNRNRLELDAWSLHGDGDLLAAARCRELVQSPRLRGSAFTDGGQLEALVPGLNDNL
jgi:hypothetical protein